MDVRRNFIHNCIVHPICGLIWLVADTIGLIGARRIKNILVEAGERVHTHLGANRD